MKKYTLVTTLKSFEVESASMLSTLATAYRKMVKDEELIAVVREGYSAENPKILTENAIKILDILLQSPDILIDAVSNETTDYDAEELVKYAIKELNQ